MRYVAARTHRSQIAHMIAADSKIVSAPIRTAGIRPFGLSQKQSQRHTRAACNMQRAHCNMQRAHCDMHMATCNVQRAACNVQIETCGTD